MLSQPLNTEAEMISHALTLATAVIDFVDPEQTMSEGKGAVLAIEAAHKAVRDHNPEKAAFDVYYRMILQNSVAAALMRGNTNTWPDACLQLLDAANGRSN